jgi:hypothetical protein
VLYQLSYAPRGFGKDTGAHTGEKERLRQAALRHLRMALGSKAKKVNAFSISVSQ